MKKYLFIGVGGFVGAVIRYAVKGLDGGIFSSSLPVQTLIVNGIGAFLLAFLLTAELHSLQISKELKLGLSAGFLGALTTFSTLCKETVGLITSGAVASGILYMLISLVIGLSAAAVGIGLSRKLMQNTENSGSDQRTEPLENAESDVE